ncbi:AtzH-like domain-containing protein [Georgenia sp. Z1491]|uniref:AtzH-like domain-containing protein n=1 Tax=Georgenia sp. Z1491 TaxID=3416707 RepID=UPI003CF25183
MHTTTAPGPVEAVAPVRVDGTAPPALLDAFWAYDRALLANDLEALGALFLDAEDTLRGDGTTLTVGHRAITAYRSARGTAPTRQVVAVHVRDLAPGTALVMAEVRSPTGTPGLQTQVWRRTDDGWRVAAAHVTAPPRTVDHAVWRVVGSPLLAPSSDGELTGETVAVKDVLALRGQAVGGGVPALLAERQPEAKSSPAVDALLLAGAAVTGVAQTDQLAYSIAGTNPATGTPPNLEAPGRVPGGSSSGPAVAVRRGEVSIGLGTDTAGSIRVPAAYQGLWGLRPTQGAVPTDGMLPLAPSFDTVGLLTRGPGTLLRAARVVLGGDSPSATPDRPRSYVVVDAITGLADTSLGLQVEELAEHLRADRAGLPGDLDEWFAAFRTVQAFEAWQSHGAWIVAHPGALAPDVAERFGAASRVSAGAASEARETLDVARSLLRDLVADRILLLPTTSGPPPALTASPASVEVDRSRTLRLTSLASLAGLPAVSAPLLHHGRSRAGVSFVGPPGSDLALVRAAGAVAAR